MNNPAAFLCACLAWCVMAVAAWAGEARVQVATLDGVPVYHWLVFTSSLPDDVDRALVLREFKRKQFKIPSKLVDDEIKRVAEKNFGGDEGKLRKQLQAEGASIEDFKHYLTEEISITAMRYQKSKGQVTNTVEKGWLAGLRAGADVKMLPEAGKKVEP